LSVLAITHEGKSDTEKWVKDKDARYAYAYDTSSRLMSEFGFTGLPSAMLIDATGVVRWTGHPASIRESDIESALAGALPIPMWEWPKEATGVRKALQKQDYQKALEAAQKLDDGEQYVAAVRGVIAGRLASLETKFEAGDFLGAYETAKVLKKVFKGLPEQDRVNEIYDKIKDDDAAQEVIKGQEDVADIAEEAAELRKKKDAEDLLDDLRKVQEKYAGTFAAEQASELADKIRKMLPKLR